MADTQKMGIAQKLVTIVIVDNVVGDTHLASKLAMGVTQKAVAGAQWTQTDSPTKDACGISLKAPTVVVDCIVTPSTLGMGCSQKVPTITT